MLGRGRRGAPVKRSAVGARPPSGGHGPQGLFLVLLQMVHVEITGRFKPVLVHLDGQCPDQPQAALGVGEDAHDMGAALEFLVQPFEHVGRFHMFMMRQRQPIIGQRLFDIVLNPVA